MANRLQQACVLVNAGHRGTGFLVSETEVLTCAHVVTGLRDGAEVDLCMGMGMGVGGANLKGTLKRRDNQLDLALIAIAAPAAAAQPLPLAGASVQVLRKTPWQTYGYPTFTDSSILYIDGDVREPDGFDLHGRRALQLFSEMLTSLTQPDGLSGAPVFGGGVVLGMICQTVRNAEAGTAFGTLYAIPSSTILGWLGEQRASGADAPVDGPIPGGPYNPAHYISRPDEEATAQGYLRDAGSPVILWGPQKFGKSWLLGRLLDWWRLQPHGGHHAVIDLHEISTQETFDYSHFLHALASLLAKRVHSDVPLLRRRSNLVFSQPDFADVLEAVLSAQGAPGLPLLIAFKHADVIVDRPYARDFFNFIRSLAEKRSSAWSGLRLLFTVSVKPKRLDTAAESSPLQNLGEPIELMPFDAQQVSIQAAHYRSPWDKAALQSLREWLGGHPHFTALILSAGGTRKRSFERMQGTLPASIRRHLSDCETLLHQSPTLQEAVRTMAEHGTTVLEPGVEDTLYRLGLIEAAPSEREVLYKLRGTLYLRLVRR